MAGQRAIYNPSIRPPRLPVGRLVMFIHVLVYAPTGTHQGAITTCFYKSMQQFGIWVRNPVELFAWYWSGTSSMLDQQIGTA